MAQRIEEETYTHATIDAHDGTITEYLNDDVRTYSLRELMNRWDGIADVSLTIRRACPV